jgi:hypothetical protein
MCIDSIMLFPRSYSVEPWVADAAGLSDLDWVRSAATFVVSSGRRFMGGANVTSEHGISFIPTRWSARILAPDVQPANAVR